MSRILLLALLLPHLAITPGRSAPACEWKPSRPVEVTPLPVPGDEGSGIRLGELRLLGVMRLRSRDPAFGGFSALEFAGGRLLALSDRGTLWRLPDALAEGRAPASARWDRCRLSTATGVPDAESLAASDGTLILAAEGNHALYRLDPDGGPGLDPLPLPGWLRAAPLNAGLEAVARLSDGRLLLLTEGLLVAPGMLRAALRTDQGFLPLRYPTREGFVPVGADALEDTVYVLERRFSLFGGFAARILALEPPARPPAGSLLAPRELARLETPLPSDNFEGIAVRRGAGGVRDIYLVSDDNFSPLQATLLVRLQHRPRGPRGPG